MNEIERINDQLKRSLEKEAWPGPALLESLAGLTAKDAAERPIKNAHTIWEILRHVTATANEVLDRLRGIGTSLSADDDWPPVPAGVGEAAWQADLENLLVVHDELSDEIAKLDESKLDAPILPDFSGFYVTLHGLVQHNLYHAGQIAMLRKHK